MKKTITSIIRKGNRCIIYHDDGMFCSWSDIMEFNYDLIKETKEQADGLVLLVSEEEAKANGGSGADFDDHEKWCIPKHIIWEVYGDLPATNDDLINFIWSCII